MSKKRIVTYNNGETIIKIDDVEKRMYIILSGEVEISLTDGIKHITLAVLKKNDFFGEISLFNDLPRSATAVAKGTVKLTYLNSVGEMDEFMKHNPKFTREMVKVLTSRLAKTDELLKKELGGKSKAKLTGFLW